MQKYSLASSRRYRGSNFTDVIVNTMSNMSVMKKVQQTSCHIKEMKDTKVQNPRCVYKPIMCVYWPRIAVQLYFPGHSICCYAG